jgi:DNA-binding transcriptional LysR family regulator
MVSDFDWTLMRSFLAAIETGSLLAASRRLKVSQPTLGRHINELEQQLSAVLFERTGRGLKPTEAAIAIAEHARAMDSGADAIRRTLTGRNAQTAGTVRITASQTVACLLLPPLLVRLQQQSPEIQIELVASDQISNLLRREADIAVRMVRPDQSSLIARKIGSLSLGLYASNDYLKRFGTPVRASDFSKHRLIGYDTSDIIIRGFARNGIVLSRDHFVIRSDDHLVAWQAALAGAGIAVLAQHVARSSRLLRQVLPALPLPPLPVWLTVHREIRTSRLIRHVYDFLAEAIPAVVADQD